MKTTTLRSLVGAVLFAVLASPAMAEDRAQAETALKQGVKEYKLGKFEQALQSYQSAAELAPSAAGPYREMGKTFEALGQDENAIEAYSEYLSRRPNASDAKEIQGRLDALKAKRPITGAIVFAAARPGHDLWIDGQPFGNYTANEPLSLLAGEHRIELRAADRVTFSQALYVAPGETREIAITAEKALAAKPVAAAVPVAEKPAAKRERHPGRWVVLGLGVAATAATGAFFLLGQEDGFEDNIQPRPVGAALPSEAAPAAKADPRAQRRAKAAEALGLALQVRF
jgi:tetratricopeptide (TPR) repeat protein